MSNSISSLNGAIIGNGISVNSTLIMALKQSEDIADFSENMQTYSASESTLSTSVAVSTTLSSKSLNFNVESNLVSVEKGKSNTNSVSWEKACEQMFTGLCSK